MPGQTPEVVRSMICLQGSDTDLTRAGEYWLGKVGSGYGRPRKPSRIILSQCDWTSFPPQPPVDLRNHRNMDQCNDLRDGKKPWVMKIMFKG